MGFTCRTARRVAVALALLTSAGAAAQTPAETSGEGQGAAPSGSASQPSQAAPPTVSPATAPAPELAVWFYMRGGVSVGPVPRAEVARLVRAGVLSTMTLVWRQGLPGWRVLGQLPEFAGVEAPRPGPPTSAPPAALAPPVGQPPSGRVPIRGLVISGTVVLSVFGGLAVLTAGILGTIEDEGTRRVARVLWIPLAGPAIAATQDDTDDSFVNFMWAMWTLGEVTGAALLTGGLIGRKRSRHMVTGELGGGWRIRPLLGRTNGLGLTRTF